LKTGNRYLNLLTLQEVLVLFIGGIHNNIVTSCVEQLVLIDEMQIVLKLSVNTEDKSA